MSRLFASLRLRLRSVFQRNTADRELDEELQYHLDREIAEGLAKGRTAEEARHAALRTLGAITQSKEECRELRSVTRIENLVHDFRYGIRTLRRNPAFTMVAVLVLAVGIGANTAMFSVAFGILLRPLPYADSDRVAAVHMNYAGRDEMFGTMCVRDFQIWKENNRAFEEPALSRTRRLDISGSGRDPEQVRGAIVTAGFFTTLGVAPLIGRTFAAGDDVSGAPSLAVLGESLWLRRFAGSPAVLGQTILIGGNPFTVIGVMPDAFRFPRREMEIWTNLSLNPQARHGPWFYRGVARLKPGVSFDQARTELNVIAHRIAQNNPEYKQVSFSVLGLRDSLLGTAVKPTIYLLAGAVGLLLLIALVNVANLILARATVREREMALRISLGAGRGRLVRQLLAEGLLLSIVGGMAGLAFAWGSVHLIRIWNPGNLPLIDSVRLDWSAFAFTFFLSMLAGVLFGLTPALGSGRADLSSAIKEGGRGATATRTRGRVRGALVISEIALSLILLVGAGLLLRSLANLQRVTGGFSAAPRQILSVLVSAERQEYNDPAVARAYFEEVLRRARNVRGVESAALSDSLPPDRMDDANSFEIEGQPLAPGETNPAVPAVIASPGFFAALRIPLIKGRDLSPHDIETSAPVVVVSEGFAGRFFPNQNPIGKRLRQGGPWMEIVGVAGNVKYLGLTIDTDPAYYMPFAQSSARRMYLVVRSSKNAAELAEPIRRDVQAIDPSVTLAQMGTMEQAFDLSVARPRFNTMLLVLFAGIALVLAAAGIYGLIAYWVAQRTKEIGVRMALGAARTDVVLMVIQEGASLAAIGIVAGLGGAVVLTRLLETMLFGVGMTDALTLVGASLGIALVVVLATFFPAYRATQVSPLVALRYD